MPRTISKKDAEFNREQRVITDGAAQHITEWSIPEPWFSSTVLPARDRWEQAYADCNVSPAERTGHLTSLKKKARGEYEPLVRQVAAIMAGNPVVTDADLASMGIFGRRMGKHVSRVPVPADVPDARIVPASDHRLIMHFHAHRQQREGSVAKPYGVRGAEIAWALSGTPPASHDDLVKRDSCTASPRTFSFDISDAGKTLYAAVRWENTRGEKGPWSVILSAIVP
jgi:hypothetical protein